MKGNPDAWDAAHKLIAVHGADAGLEAAARADAAPDVGDREEMNFWIAVMKAIEFKYAASQSAAERFTSENSRKLFASLNVDLDSSRKSGCDLERERPAPVRRRRPTLSQEALDPMQFRIIRMLSEKDQMAF